jgi:hypothetical protein
MVGLPISVGPADSGLELEADRQSVPWRLITRKRPARCDECNKLQRMYQDERDGVVVKARAAPGRDGSGPFLEGWEEE